VRGRSAAWHPDGRRISVYTWDYEKMAPVFWTVPLKSGEGLKTEVDPGLLRRMGGISSGRFVGDARFSWAPSGDTIYFECTAGGATNLWKIAVDQNTLRGSGIERLTTGSGHDAGVAVTPDGKKIAFSGESRQIQVWAAPFDPRSGKLSGKGELVTSPGIEAWTLSLAPHGERLAFSGNRGGSSQIWDKSLVSGQVSLVIGDDAYARLHPLWSPDGTRLAYLRMKVHGSENKIVVWSSDSKEEQAITDGGEYDVYGWSHDGRELVVSKWSEKTKKAEVWLLLLSSGLCTEQIAASPDYHLFQGQFSPDGRWVAFEAVQDVPNGRESTIYVVPAHGGAWIRVTDGRQWDDKPRWSPDGRRLYFISAHGGFYNIWGNRFDPANGRVVGNPFQVTEFDNPALMVPIYIPDVGMSIAQGRLAVTVSQSSGSIWAEQRRRLKRQACAVCSIATYGVLK
jgi:Tol biopolymer transport system component